MKNRALAVLLFVALAAPAAAQVVTLYSCPNEGSGGDQVDRGFYVTNYPAAGHPCGRDSVGVTITGNQSIVPVVTAPIPTLSEFAMAALSALLMHAGFAAMRRRDRRA